MKKKKKINTQVLPSLSLAQQDWITQSITLQFFKKLNNPAYDVENLSI